MSRHIPPQYRPKSWDDLSPSKHMLLGIGLMILCTIGAVVAIFLTIWFSTTIGFLQTITMYLGITAMVTFYRIYTRHGQHRIGFRTVQTWDTEAADNSGSTARGGIPHDPYGIIPHPSRTRRPKE